MRRRSSAPCRNSLVVRTSRCGRENPGSNPGYGNSGEPRGTLLPGRVSLWAGLSVAFALYHFHFHFYIHPKAETLYHRIHSYFHPLSHKSYCHISMHISLIVYSLIVLISYSPHIPPITLRQRISQLATLTSKWFEFGCVLWGKTHDQGERAMAEVSIKEYVFSEREAPHVCSV